MAAPQPSPATVTLVPVQTALPTELLHLIVECCASYRCLLERCDTLYTLLQVNKLFYTLAHPLLYRSLRATIVCGVRRRDPAVEPAFHTLDTHSDSSRLVETLELTVRSTKVGGQRAGLGKSRIPALPNLRTAILKRSPSTKWTKDDPSRSVLCALGSSAPHLTILDLSSLNLGNDWWRFSQLLWDDEFWWSAFRELEEVRVGRRTWMVWKQCTLARAFEMRKIRIVQRGAWMALATPTHAAAVSSRALPTELLLRIFSFIDRNAIADRRASYRALALASKHFYTLAQPRLHSAICADIVFAVRRRDPVLESAFHALDKSPDLASCVEILELTVKAGDLGGRTGGMAKSRIPAMPKLRKVVLKPEVPNKWSRQTSLTLVLIALGSTSPRIESLNLSDFSVGPDKSSISFPIWHCHWLQTGDISNDLFDFCWHGKGLRDAFPKLRELKLAKKGWRSSSDRHLLVQDLKGQGVKAILV
ncbi:hypothetical protein JCM10296v2_006122 [Rhodotorula toruloides]